MKAINTKSVDMMVFGGAMVLALLVTRDNSGIGQDLVRSVVLALSFILLVANGILLQATYRSHARWLSERHRFEDGWQALLTVLKLWLPIPLMLPLVLQAGGTETRLVIMMGLVSMACNLILSYRLLAFRSTKNLALFVNPKNA